MYYQLNTFLQQNLMGINPTKVKIVYGVHFNEVRFLNFDFDPLRLKIPDTPVARSAKYMSLLFERRNNF